MKILAIFTIFALFAASVDGLSCWVCENAPSNDVCQLLGRLQECLPNENACQNEVRTGDDGIRITKRCKQALACQNNFLQNNRPAWYPTQCNTEMPSSVCRCCCNTTNCNWPNADCSNGLPVEAVEPDEVTCEALPTPTNGIKACTNADGEPQSDSESEIGTVCEFSCVEGYNLLGETSSECVSTSDTTAAFNDPAPLCLPRPADIFVPPPPCKLLETPKFGSQVCDPEVLEESVEVGTRCYFDCDEGYMLDGSKDSTCVHYADVKFSRFDEEAPICVPRYCTLPPLSDFGLRHCNGAEVDGAVEVETQCRYDCQEGYLLDGDEDAECVYDSLAKAPRFNRAPPTCVRDNLCDDFGKVDGGEVTCTNDYEIGSRCTVECDEGRRLFPDNRTEITCMEDTMWNSMPACCVRHCPVTVMDLAIVLDSSGSIGAANWDRLLKFVRDFLREVEIGDGAARVSVISYSKDVDLKSKILFNKFLNRQKQLIKNINNVRFQWQAETTNTGKALDYVNFEIFKRRNGERRKAKNVVLVITDGRATDDVLGPAKKLREKATIFALGIEPDSNFDYVDLDELREVAGSFKNVMFVRRGYEGLTKEIADHVMKHLCDTPNCGEETDDFQEVVRLHIP
ncbi:E-selectin-like [Clavelina lepadiformis]|uniref:E-selectin-like n=1 Tax=Clavelina lepadiformis TaxID=159417 RepID=UPI00404268C1